MITRLKRRLHRDRRRIAVCFALLFAAGVVETWNTTDLFPPGVLEVATGVGLMLLVGSVLILGGLALPSVRHAYAPIGLTLFGTAVLGRLLPGSAFSLLHITQGGPHMLTGLITTGLLVHFVFYGRWSDRWLRVPRARLTTRLTTTRLDGPQCWHGFVPSPGRREAMFDPDILSVDWVDRDRRRIRVIRWRPPEGKAEEFLHVEDYLPGAYIVYRYARARRGQKGYERGLRAVKLIDMTDRRVLYFTEFFYGRSLRGLLFDWLDDTLGRREDARLAHLEGAVARAAKSPDDQLAVGGVLRPAAPKAPARPRKPRTRTRPAPLATAAE